MTLPSLTDGETLYSWSAKTRLAFGWSARRCSIELFGSLRSGNGYSLPVGIPHLVERFNGVLGSAEALAAERTILAGHLPWMSVGRGAAVLQAVCQSRILQARMLLASRSDRSVELGPPRFCVECCRQDRRNLGYSRWLVEHQLPGYWACMKHQVGLLVPTARLAMTLPSETLPARQVIDPSLGPHFLSFGLRFSAHALQVMGLRPIAPRELRAAIVNQLTARGLISNPARLGAGRLHGEFVASRTAQFLRHVCSTDWWQNKSWLVRSLRAASDLSPLKWLTLWIWAFENEAAELSKYLLQTCVISAQPLHEGSQFVLWPWEGSNALAAAFLERIRFAMVNANSLEDVQKTLGVGHGVLSRWFKTYPTLRQHWKELRLQARREVALQRLAGWMSTGQHTTWADLTKDAIAEVRWLERNDSDEYARLKSSIPQDRPSQRRLFGPG